MSDEEKTLDELLKKLETFTSSINEKVPSIQNKPQYVNVLEAELKKPILDLNNYIQIPFNPIKETFSGFIVQYFLAKDKLLSKIVGVYSNFEHLDAPPYIRYIDIETNNNGILSLVHINTFSVMLIRSNERIRDIIDEMSTNLSGGIMKKYWKSETTLIEDDELGLATYIMEEPVTRKDVLLEVSQKSFIKETVEVESSLTNKIYYVRGYLLSGDSGKVLLILKDEILSYYERVLKDYFMKA